MKMNLNEVFNSAQFVGYVEEIKPDLGKDNKLQSLFPVKPIDGLDYSYIKTAKGAIELTSPSAFDAEPINQNREGFDAMAGELPLFRKKMVLSEKEKYKLDLYLKSGKIDAVKRLMAQIYDDQSTLVDGAYMMLEFLRARALFDGKISIVSKGGAVSVDYKVPAANKHVLTVATEKWSHPDAKIVKNIKEWCDTVEESTGVRPTEMILNRKTAKYFATNTEIRTMATVRAFGNNVSGAFVPDSAVLDAVKMATGLNSITVYNKKVTLDKVTKDLVEDGKVVIVPNMTLGDTMIGTSPAELAAGRANAAGGQVSITSDGFAINITDNKKSPYTHETEVEFIGLPSFIASDLVVQATVY